MTECFKSTLQRQCVARKHKVVWISHISESSHHPHGPYCAHSIHHCHLIHVCSSISSHLNSTTVHHQFLNKEIVSNQSSSQINKAYPIQKLCYKQKLLKSKSLKISVILYKLQNQLQTTVFFFEQQPKYSIIQNLFTSNVLKSGCNLLLISMEKESNDIGYNSYTASDGNIVWAGAMTLAWKQLMAFAKVAELKVDKSDEIANKFNYSLFSKESLEEKSYYIKSGFGIQTIRAINKQRNQKFPQCSFPLLSEDVQESTIISYAYLYKQISFPVQFSSYPKPYFEFRGKTKTNLVLSFQAFGQQQFGQICCLQYQNSDNFLVMIKGVNENDEIYILKSSNDQLDVKGAIEKVVNSNPQKKGCRYLNNDEDKFEVPVLNLDYEYDHPDLTGARITNFENREISSIKQGLKLKLDHKGARVQNYGQIFTDECAIVNPNERIIICNSPFWVLMRERNRLPYLCVKINDL